MPIWLIVMLCGVMLIVTAHVVYGKRTPQDDHASERTQDDEANTWLDAVSATLQSMFEEWTLAHDALRNDVVQAQKQWEAQAQTMMQRIEALQQTATSNPTSHNEQSPVPLPKVQAKKHVRKAHTPKDTEPVYAIRSKFDELLTLHEEGKSIEYIAKKLNKNKGEVQLIIRLAQTEGA